MLIDGIEYFSKDNIENLPYKEISAAYDIETDDRLLVNTSGGTFNVTLPTTPYTGQSVRFASNGSWTTTNWTLLRNGKKIQGIAEDLTVDDDVSFSLVFSGSDDDWRLF